VATTTQLSRSAEALR